jgi:hypothetical protein
MQLPLYLDWRGTVLITIKINVKWDMQHAKDDGYAGVYDVFRNVRKCDRENKTCHEARVVLLLLERAWYSSSSSLSLYSSVAINGPYAATRSRSSALRILRIREDSDLKNSVCGLHQHTTVQL